MRLGSGITARFYLRPIVALRRRNLDRRQSLGSGRLLRLGGGNIDYECTDKETGREQNVPAQMAGGCGRHGSDLGMTSVARHSEPSPTLRPKPSDKAMSVLPDRHRRV